MSIVAYKYTPEAMSEDELQRTFAARWDTLNYLLEELRKQSPVSTPSSYLMTGPRGAGKSTLLRMLRVKIHEDAKLRDEWLLVPFTEEQHNVASLRDLLAATLELLSLQGVAFAAEWLRKVEAETDDDQSQDLAVSALKEISRAQKKRLILFIENLDQLFDRGLSDKMKGTLRRLLMTDAFMIIIGSAVHVFESLRSYDKAFFNYFCPVPLARLTDQEVFDMLHRRAEFDENKDFLRHFSEHRPQIRAITHLSGGNPRLILMLYELLSEKRVATIVQQLRRLVDELTPLYKHEIENLPPQQQKIFHALMEKGGTAKPSEITEATRLSLNKVTMQLRRLKEMQILELRGGGKGRPAFYTAPDTLLSIWYQMRYLRPQRRRIEMFVQVLQIWFEAEERYKTLESLTSVKATTDACKVRERAAAAEYFAASLTGTSYEEKARTLALRLWIRLNDLREAAFAHAEFCNIQAKDEIAYEKQAFASLGEWSLEHDDLQTAVSALEKVAEGSDDPRDLVQLGTALRKAGQNARAIGVLDRAINARPTNINILAMALANRVLVRGELGDSKGMSADLTAIIENSGMPQSLVARALYYRGVKKGLDGDLQGSIEDQTRVIGMPDAAGDVLGDALLFRGRHRMELGDLAGAIPDLTAVIEEPQTPKAELAEALVNRGYSKNSLGDVQGALADCTAVIEMLDAPPDRLAYALVMRGRIESQQGEDSKAIADLTRAIELPEADQNLVAEGLVQRGWVKIISKDSTALADFERVLSMPDVPPENACFALIGFGFARGLRDENEEALNAFLRAVRVPGASETARIIATKNGMMFCAAANMGEKAEELLESFAASLERSDRGEKTRAITELLQQLAAPDLRKEWPVACRYFIKRLPPEVTESLRIFLPVCEVLEGAEVSVLDALPPEQRTFALKLLDQFKEQPSDEREMP